MVGELRFAVLGPVRAWRGHIELELGSPQQRAVLAALLLAEGRQVSLNTLVGALWGADVPRSAVGTVRTYVSRLRQSLGADAVRGVRDVIGSVGDGYRVPLDSATLDLDLFLRGLKEAHAARDAGAPTQAAGLLAEAVELWQGSRWRAYLVSTRSRSGAGSPNYTWPLSRNGSPWTSRWAATSRRPWNYKRWLRNIRSGSGSVSC
jgi:DNA-binding SARP family transcriptional activator